MGFEKFKVISPYSNEGDISKIPQAVELPKDTQKSFQHLSDIELNNINFSPFKDIQKREISCEAASKSMIYLDCDKKLWPCCWMARTSDHRLRLTQREEFYRKVYTEYGLQEGFNSVLGKELFSVLNLPFFKAYLPQSWEQESINSQKCLSICLE